MSAKPSKINGLGDSALRVACRDGKVFDVVQQPKRCSTMSGIQDSAMMQILLRAYPLLPGNALVPRPVIIALAGISDSKLWAHVREGTLDTPIRTGKRGVHWRKESVEKFLNRDMPLAAMGESPVGRKRKEGESHAH